MITKITATNDQEYYAPRFAYISKELQKRDDLANVAGITNMDLPESVTYNTKLQYNTNQGAESSVALEDGTFSTVFVKDTEAYRIEAHRHLVIDSIESYFANITSIGQLYTENHEDINPGYLFLTMPADEEYFTIDANTRTISVPAAFKKNGVGVYGDHLAEMLVFKIDRYFDYQDLYNTKIAINWNFMPNGSRNYLYEQVQHEEAFAPNDVLEPEYIVFGFPITKEMTPGKGTLEFSVSFYTVGPSNDFTEDNFIDYSLNTMTASVTINAGLGLEDPKEVKSIAKPLLKRIQNSSYTPDGVSSITTPIWRTGDVSPDDETKLLGLTKTLDFEMFEDGTEAPILNLWAQAYSAGHIGAMNYTWFSSDLDGTATNDLSQSSVLAEVKKLENAPNDNNNLLSQANQNNISIEQKGADIIVHGNLSSLNSFTSTNPSQGSGKWLGFDIGTTVESIADVKWNGIQLSNADVEESASVGLAANHIIFWSTAEKLLDGVSIRLSAEEKNDAIINFIFIDESKVISPKDFKQVMVKDENSIFEQNHIYYYEDELGKINTINYIASQAELNALENGTKLYELGSNYQVTGAGNYLVKAQASKTVINGANTFVINSPITESIICTVPAAVKPEKPSIIVESQLELPEDCIIEDPSIKDSDGLEYTYIASDVAPKVSVIVNSTKEKLGAVALEMALETELKDLNKQDIESGNYEFIKVADTTGRFEITKDKIEEGEYCVRAINYKNHSYSVSDISDKIVTAFIAPAITDIDVTTIEGENIISALVKGKIPTDDNKPQVIISYASKPNLQFKLEDKSENNLPGAITSYFVEELVYDEASNSYLPRAEITSTPDEQEDIFEVISDNGELSFTINGDNGFYRIKTINRYKGTAQTAYTDVFHVVKG